MNPFTQQAKTWLVAAAWALGLGGCGTPTAAPSASVALMPMMSNPSPPAPSPVAAGAAPKALLWIGNSFFYFNNSMHDHVRLMLNASGLTGMRQNSVTISAAGIDWHDVGSHFKPGGMASYSFSPTNEVVFNRFDRPFDAVLMMDCSQCPIHPQLKDIFFDTMRKHSATVRSNGAEPLLFMSWAYQDKPEMTEQLAVEYIKAGKENNALVVPAGYAFAKSIAKRPELNLYMPDKRHPSLAGTYLAAAVVMASVYKRSPVGNSYTAGLPAEVATHLQNVAWETVQSFKP